MSDPYPERRMTSGSSQIPAPSPRFLVEIMILGGVVGILLILLEAPLWLFYLAPLVGVPPLIHRLRELDHGPGPRRRGDSSPDSHGSGIAGIVLFLVATGVGVLLGWTPVRWVTSNIESSSEVHKVSVAPIVPADLPEVPQKQRRRQQTVDRSQQVRQQMSNRRQVATAVQTSSSRSTSSPLIPILIVVATRAAISVGALYVRQGRSHRQRESEPAES
jgi:hypothetical protein